MDFVIPSSSLGSATETPTLRHDAGLRIKKFRHTDRSRPTSAIKALASKVANGRVLSQKATDMMEDIMYYSCKEVMRAAASLCSGSKKTVTDKIGMDAFSLVFRHSAIQKKSHDVGVAALHKYNSAEAQKKSMPKGSKLKIKLSGQDSVIGHIMSANRVGTTMRRYMIHPCVRLSEGAIVYATGFLENFLACVIKSADSLIKDGKNTRMKTKDISMALSLDIELRGVIPEEIVVKFHGQHSGVKRKRPADITTEKKKRPNKKRSRKN